MGFSSDSLHIDESSVDEELVTPAAASLEEADEEDDRLRHSLVSSSMFRFVSLPLLLSSLGGVSGIEDEDDDLDIVPAAAAAENEANFWLNRSSTLLKLFRLRQNRFSIRSTFTL